MVVGDVLDRAKSVVGADIAYRLGSGGMDPDSPTPAGKDGACDCSGYVAWCLGLSRMTDEPFYVRANGGQVAGIGTRGWINTDAMAADIVSDVGIFRRSMAMPGAVIVYPGPPRRPVGHCGIILRVQENTPTAIIHCAASHSLMTSHAVQVTDATIFEQQSDTVIGMFSGLQSEIELQQPSHIYQDVPLLPKKSRWHILLLRVAYHILRRYL